LQETIHAHLYGDETDPVLQLIKKIMYAEGDLIDLRHESALYLKDALQALSKVFKIEEGE
jgi:hypothetical protein